MLLRERWFRAAEGADGGGAPEDGGAPAPKGGNEKGGKSVAAGEFDTRPDWLPEQFYNPETKGPRIKELAKGWLDLRTKVAKGVDSYKREFEEQRAAEIAKHRPVEPDGYKIELDPKKFENIVLLDEQPGDDFQAEEGKHYAVLDQKDPMLQWWKKTAHELGLSHAQFSEGVAGFIESTLAKAPDYEAEVKKLGDNAKARVQEVDGWMRGNLNEAAYKAFEKFARTAEGIEALEQLISSAGGPKLGAKPSTATSDEVFTPAKVREMTKDPRYWDHRRRDPAYVQQVEEAYKRAFQGQVQIAALGPSR